jgi:hypothetical protein
MAGISTVVFLGLLSYGGLVVFLTALADHNMKAIPIMEDSTIFIANSRADVVRMSAGEYVEGTWWHVAGVYQDYVVKAPTLEGAKSLITREDRQEILIGYEFRPMKNPGG